MRYLWLLLFITLNFISPQIADAKGDDAFNRLVTKLTDEMSRVRRLAVERESNKQPFSHRVVSKQTVRSYILKRFKEEYSEAEIEQEAYILKSLGLLPADIDYKQAVVDFMLAELGGYYDPFETTLFLADWIPMEMQKPVIAHELVHALQDIHFNLKPFLKRDSTNDDASIAKQALVEGDATYAMYLYQLGLMGKQVNYLSDSQVDLLSGETEKLLEGMAGSSPSVPKVIRKINYFPYTAGLKFVATVKGTQPNWDTVDAAYKRLPQSTAEILHPESYGDKGSVTLPDLSKLKSKWSLLTQNVFGELGCIVLLTEHGDETAAKDICQHWQGDRYGLFEDSDKKRMLLYTSRWPNKRHAKAFRGALTKHIKKTSPLKPSNKRQIKLKGTQVLFRIVES